MRGNSCATGSRASISLGLLSGKPRFLVRDTGGGTTNPNGQFVDSPVAVNDGAFHHLVAVRNVEDATMVVFIDGAVAVSAPLDPAAAGPLQPGPDGEIDPFVIGAAWNYGSPTFESFFVGDIDELSFYDRALGQIEAAAIFGAGVSGKCP